MGVSEQMIEDTDVTHKVLNIIYTDWTKLIARSNFGYPVFTKGMNSAPWIFLYEYKGTKNCLFH